ncbi:MAG: ZIP family metal transporter, partial [Anaerolineales bacterium]
MADQTLNKSKSTSFTLTTAVLLILPLVVLGGVIALFLSSSGGLNLSSPAPIEALTVERTVLTPGHIAIHVRNGSPEELTIAQVIINDAVWRFSATPDATIPRLGRATVNLDYMWSQGEAYGITLFTNNSIPFDVEIPVAFVTPQPRASTFWSLTLVGIYVGIIPVYLGLLWFPALRQLGRRAMTFLLAVTAGLLVFLGLDTLSEALELSSSVPGPFQGVGLVGIGVVATFFLLDAISRRQVGSERSEADRRLM